MKRPMSRNQLKAALEAAIDTLVHADVLITNHLEGEQSTADDIQRYFANTHAFVATIGQPNYLLGPALDAWIETDTDTSLDKLSRTE